MRIVIDLQSVQGKSRNRGIGRYSLALVKAMIKNKGEHEILLLLNGSLPQSIPFIKNELRELLQPNMIKIWYPNTPYNHLNSRHDYNLETTKLIYEAFLANLEPDMILITSLFEIADNHIAVSIDKLTTSLPFAVILYDLIPLIQEDLYLENPILRQSYFQALATLKKADLILAISQSAKQEAEEHLFFPSKQCINISSAANDIFRPITITHEQKKLLLEKFSLKENFIMYPGAIDPRKNIAKLIQAYAQLPRDIIQTFQLAIVCKATDLEMEYHLNEAKKLGLNNNEVIFTNFVTDQELLFLYNLCELLVFPSIHEGFGLPILEAQSCGTAAIASNTSSMPEVVGDEAALFDPYNPLDIRDKIQQYLEDENKRKELEQHGLNHSKNFSWEITAKKAIATLEKFHCAKEQPVMHNTTRQRLAFISPLSPDKNISDDYSSDLLTDLINHYEIDVITDQKTVNSPWVSANCTVRDIKFFMNNYSHYDRVLYHFGNSTFHQHMFDLLAKYPGIVVLHDFYLSSILSYMESQDLKSNRWSNALYYSHGYSALTDLETTSDKTTIIHKYPCNLEVLQNAISIFTHSHDSKNLIYKFYPGTKNINWSKIPFVHKDSIATNKTGSEQIKQASSNHAKSFIKEQYNPRFCTQQYYQAIEDAYHKNLTSLNGLIEKIKQLTIKPHHDNSIKQLASLLALNFPENIRQKQILFDISHLVSSQKINGEEKIKSTLTGWLNDQNCLYRIEPVRQEKSSLLYARKFSQQLLMHKNKFLQDETANNHPNDIVIIAANFDKKFSNHLDFYSNLSIHCSGLYFIVDEITNYFSENLHIITQISSGLFFTNNSTMQQTKNIFRELNIQLNDDFILQILPEKITDATFKKTEIVATSNKIEITPLTEEYPL